MESRVKESEYSMIEQIEAITKELRDNDFDLPRFELNKTAYSGWEIQVSGSAVTRKEMQSLKRIFGFGVIKALGKRGSAPWIVLFGEIQVLDFTLGLVVCSAYKCEVASERMVTTTHDLTLDEIASKQRTIDKLTKEIAARETVTEENKRTWNCTAQDFVEEQPTD